MPMYERYGTSKYPVAEALAAQGLNLPSSPALADADVARVVESIRRFLR
jgi:dTDP-4-amino-4,6-dideoxygalactose transaminase